MSYRYQIIEGLGEVCLIRQKGSKARFRGYLTDHESFKVFGKTIDEVILGLFSKFGVN